MCFTICTLRNPGTWKWFSKDIKAKRGILLQPDGIFVEKNIFVQVRRKVCRDQGERKSLIKEKRGRRFWKDMRSQRWCGNNVKDKNEMRMWEEVLGLRVMWCGSL
jgi:hypothetical protein